MPRFWNWIAASEDTENRAVLVLSGAIDSGESWYEDAVWPARFREDLSAHAGENIQVEINSPGGDVFAGFEIYNMLRSHNANVRVRVTGMAASAASIVAMAASQGQLCMCEASMMMIHNPWTFAAGNSDELREQADVLDMIRDVMVDIYMNRFAGEQADLEAMLSRETWLTPARAMEHGLCDEIETAEDGSGDDTLSASAMAGRYAAMSRAQMDEIRERFGVKKEAARQPEPMAADRAAELLREADAMIAAAFNI
jgi:ATP-dependent Clp protease protease subunit